ncbi:SMI1/KNR4 family protein [Shouchella clausii]
MMSKKIWDPSVLDEYELNPLENDTVKFVENHFQVKLPESYVNLLKEQNGGYLSRNKYPFKHDNEDEDIEIDHLLGLSIKNNEGILQSEYFINEWGLPQHLILISGDGHGWVCLDYRSVNENPPVIFIDVEVEKEHRLADSFAEFINNLYQDETSKASFIDDVFEDDQTEFTYKEGEKAFSGNNVRKISFALLHFTNADSDTNWFLKQLKKLTNKKNEFIVHDAAEALYHIVNDRYGKEKDVDSNLIQGVIDKLKSHSSSVVNNYAKKIQRLFDEKNCDM